MKKIIWIPLVIIIAAAVLCFFHFRTEEPAEVERETLNDPDFLKDKEALLYFSTTADQDTFGGGKSYALFADKKGRLFSYQMKGLELGSAKVHDESVLLEDKKGIYTVQDGLHTYKRAYQHTGDSAGYIDRTEGFYTLYNSGYDKSGGSYRSELYRQIDGKWKQDVIPHYIRASGFLKIIFSHSRRQMTKKAITFKTFRPIKRGSIQIQSRHGRIKKARLSNPSSPLMTAPSTFSQEEKKPTTSIKW